MHITRDKLAYNLLETIRSKVVDDEVIDIRQVKSAVDGARVILLQQKIDAKPFAPLHDSWCQVLKPTTGLKLEKVDSSQITALTSEIYMKRTIDRIPEPLIKKNGLPAFSRVGPASRLGIQFDVVTQQRALNTGFSRWTKDYVSVYLLDGYLYTHSGSEEHLIIEYLDVIGVFQNPAEVYLFNDINGSSLNADSTENYPIDLSLEIPIRQLVIDKFLGIKAEGTIDNSNNAQHDQG